MRNCCVCGPVAVVLLAVLSSVSSSGQSTGSCARHLEASCVQCSLPPLRCTKALIEPFPRAPAFVWGRAHWLPLRIYSVKSRSGLPYAPPPRHPSIPTVAHTSRPSAAHSLCLCRRVAPPKPNCACALPCPWLRLSRSMQGTPSSFSRP
jgi:hypothetical protein